MEARPYCDGNLEKGTLYSYRSAYFLPDGKSIARMAGAALEKNGGIMLRSSALITGESHPEAYQCREITIPY